MTLPSQKTRTDGPFAHPPKPGPNVTARLAFLALVLIGAAAIYGAVTGLAWLVRWLV